MITFEINKWVLIAIICGIMLLGAWIELLIACIYSNNAKKARTDESVDKITQLENEIKLQNADIELMQQNIGYLMDECNRLSEQKDNTGISAKSDAIKWLRFTELHNGLKKRVETVEKDFHDLEEHVHTWLNGSDESVSSSLMFDETTCPETYKRHVLADIVHLKNCQNICNDRLHIYGYLTVNEAREIIGADPIPEGFSTGWVLDDEGFGNVDFGIFVPGTGEVFKQMYDTLDKDSGIPIKFNIDGNIEKLLKKKKKEDNRK